MRQKLHQPAGMLVVMIAVLGLALGGCIDEPNPPVIEKLTSKVRFVHADPTTGPVDLWVDGVKKVSNLSYKNFQDYLDINSGIRLLQLTEAGKSDTVGALFAANTSIRSLMQMTIFFYPGQDGITLYIAQEKFTYANEEANIKADSSHVKVINLTSLPVTLVKDSPTGDALTAEIAAGTLTPYRNFILGSFTCWVVSRGAEVTSVQVNPASKKRYTYFLMGASEPFLLVMTDNAVPTYTP